MKQHISLRLLAMFSAGMVAFVGEQAEAAVIEGFETITLTQNTNVKGDASKQGVYFTINPTQLSNQLLLTTIDGADVGVGYTPQSPNQAVAVTGAGGLNAFFGVTAGIINNGAGINGTEGSGFRESFSFNAGDVVSFDYNFMTQEASTSGRDFAFMILLDNGGNVVQYSVLASAGTALLGTAAGNPFGSQTGYHNFAFNIASSGNYTLCLGVVDSTNSATDTNPSGLLVDNIAVAIPEPSTVGLSIAGAALLVALRRRIKGKNS